MIHINISFTCYLIYFDYFDYFDCSMNSSVWWNWSGSTRSNWCWKRSSSSWRRSAAIWAAATTPRWPSNWPTPRNGSANCSKSTIKWPIVWASLPPKVNHRFIHIFPIFQSVTGYSPSIHSQFYADFQSSRWHIFSVLKSDDRNDNEFDCIRCISYQGMV